MRTFVVINACRDVKQILYIAALKFVNQECSGNTLHTSCYSATNKQVVIMNREY